MTANYELNQRRSDLNLEQNLPRGFVVLQVQLTNFFLEATLSDGRVQQMQSV
jgi:hypothetical protein